MKILRAALVGVKAAARAVLPRWVSDAETAVEVAVAAEKRKAVAPVANNNEGLAEIEAWFLTCPRTVAVMLACVAVVYGLIKSRQAPPSVAAAVAEPGKAGS